MFKRPTLPVLILALATACPAIAQDSSGGLPEDPGADRSPERLSTGLDSAKPCVGPADAGLLAVFEADIVAREFMQAIDVARGENGHKKNLNRNFEGYDLRNR